MNAVLQVLVVDDHATVRQGLIRILTHARPGWQVRDAASGEAALALVEQAPFDVGVVDVSMPGMNGLELVRTLRERGHRLPLLMLSMHAEEAYALRAFQAGACGYITKDRAAEELVQAVQAVASGGTCIPPALAGRVHVDAHGAVVVGAHSGFTERELRVLHHLGRGESVADVASRLHLPEAAVATTRRRILDKLGLSSDRDLAEYAVTHRLMP